MGSRPPRFGQLSLLPFVAGSLVRMGLSPAHAGSRYALAKSIWTEVKRHASPSIGQVRPVELGIEGVVVAGGPSRLGPLIVAALSKRLECSRVFEFGTYLGHTAWLIALNNPSARVTTIDVAPGSDPGGLTLSITDPECFAVDRRSTCFQGTPEEARIEQLYGDTATYDYSPYREQMDLVFIDASHSYDSVRSDTEAAFAMLTGSGIVIWDDYVQYPGVYRYLNELAPGLDRRLYQVLGTQLVIYSRTDLLIKPDVPVPN